MSDNSSAYPTALDAAPVTLEEDADFVPADALTYALNQLAAIQGEIGNSAVDFTATGGPDYGTLGAFLLARCRIETGSTTLSTTKGSARISFTAGRFSAPPFVCLQLAQSGTTQPGQRDNYNAKRITKDGFTVGSGHTSRATAAGNTVWWIAVQSPFGLEENTEQTDE